MYKTGGWAGCVYRCERIESGARCCSVSQQSSRNRSRQMPGLLQCVAGCCRVLQCVAVWCSVVQCVAVCCSPLQCVAVCCSLLQSVAVCCSLLQGGAEWSWVARCVAVCSSMGQYGVATVSRIDKIIGLFCRIFSLL